MALPAGDHGRPGLLLSEDWVKKGVAIAILNAQDRKSLVLFALILVVCALFVSNAATAAVRARRTELGVLACLGWSRGRLFRVILWELGIIGLSAGIIGVGLAYPIAAITGLPFSWTRVGLVIPAAVMLALLAGVGPARRAARSDPGTAVIPAVATLSRANRPRRITTMAAMNLRRTPGRTLLASLSLGIGIAALTIIVGLTLAFRGAVVGSLLGDAVAVQVRAGDYVAVVMIVALGAFSVADMLYLNIQERAFEFAVLRATGWGEHHITRLVATEGALIGILGACAGAASGLAAVALFSRASSLPLVEVALGAALVGVIIAAASAVVPVTLLRRMPTAQLLARE